MLHFRSMSLIRHLISFTVMALNTYVCVADRKLGLIETIYSGIIRHYRDCNSSLAQSASIIDVFTSRPSHRMPRIVVSSSDQL
uniref:Putative secreted protein n=1 Tax=Anopheles marajoara TaxID=58244 RepID=A0A2M4CB44_9DIPT